MCALYVSQGLPQGFITISLKNHLYAQGHSLVAVGGMISMISLPWSLKFFWGPVIDRFGFAAMGKRRPWLILSQGLTVLVLLGLALIPDLDTSLQLLGWAILGMNIFIALQDVGTDSLAVDLIPEKDRGKINGFMYGCSYLGSFLGASFIGNFLLRDGGSMQAALIVLAACVFAIMLLPLLIRERPGEKLLPWTSGSSQLKSGEQHARSSGELFGNIYVAFQRRVALAAAGLAVLASISEAILRNVAAAYFIKEGGWDKKVYSQLESLGYWFGLGGCLIAGFFADKLGGKRAILIAGSLLASTWIIFSQLHAYWDARWLIATNMYLLAVFSGLFRVSMFTLFMNVANRQVAASQFTAYMALLNLSTFIGDRIAGWVRETLPSVSSVYLVCGLFHLGVMAFVLLAIKPPQKIPDSSPSSTGES